ncbi:unnamed protein product [Onchocerca flexuosa]|uniref:COesterase domain-containing protein n=1 Tax=Onchocerca flexuosa TaxID=387005 RepID=A0A183HGN4_9BILA|nr:unnamed protein product [Onchocerca flexuosa]
MMTLGHKVYLYSFDYFNPKSFGLLSYILPFKGSTHCTDLNYVLGLNTFLSPFKYNKSDECMKIVASKLWTNFAKFGNPYGADNTSNCECFKWLPVMSTPSCYLSIDTDIPRMKKGYYYHQREFWRNLLKC